MSKKDLFKINSDQITKILPNDKIITRFIFVESIIKIALKNYQLKGNQHSQKDFIDYFLNNYLPYINRYIYKYSF